jgi:3-amino-4-hydroxybenzoic acid synthase
MKLCWLDLRNAGDRRDALRSAAIHQRVDAVVADDPADLHDLPPTIRRVLLREATDLPEELDGVDVVIVGPHHHAGEPALATRYPGIQFGHFVEVDDAESLATACRFATTDAWTLMAFQDPTRIPLEIVLAAANHAEGRLVTVVTDPSEANVVFSVLEHGPDGVLLAPGAVGDVARLKAATEPAHFQLELQELEITGVAHVGTGERACIDTCTYLRPDEGLLVGSRAHGMILCASETHPLPYMPTRPFRVNAGAIMSYTLSSDGRTSYLSELRAGGKVLAVDANGRARVVTVGRSKIETRPLLSVDAVAGDGRAVNLIVQDDWHVRVVGRGGAVLNSTALKPGDVVLGYLSTESRHVGYPIDELCHEQ